ncbi:DnaJ domain-containing protein [Artemisia annua]|uniref:DnaJ domain-containing protein n=1 Tax=Artemisia annua TaxID=35608 RepID=A0A2U1PWR3_ARTAN|nr:DnaJ domain-containing protein [Artemisia annua]
MECNREEAIKAKTIAEKKFADKDFAGAKKFTLKAQALYPELNGISQMLITLDVYISYEKKVNGESDWYGILDANPFDDDETIRKQYRKLALMLHPDKNKSVGADDAFKILSEAWTLLSDKVKRFAYDLRRNLSALQQNVSLKKEHPSADPGVNGAHPHYANKATSNPTNDSRTNSTNTTQTGPAPVHHPAPTPTPASAPDPSMFQLSHAFSCCRDACAKEFCLPNFSGYCSYYNTNIDVNERLKRARSLYEDLYTQIVLKRRREQNGQSSSVNNASNFFTMSPGTYSFAPGSN